MEGCSSLNGPTHEISYRPNADAFPGQLLTYKLALIPCLGLCTALVAATASGRKEAGVRCQGYKSGGSSLVVSGGGMHLTPSRVVAMCRVGEDCCCL